MQFNRNKYISGDFDLTNQDEIKNAYYAQQYKGLDWNNYIKDYLKRCLGDAIGTFSYDWKKVQPFANLGPFIDFGLFNQAADYLDTLESDDDGFNTNKALWSARLRAADDYAYQKAQNSDYQTFTIKEMIKDGTIDGYFAQTGQNSSSTATEDTSNSDTTSETSE